MSASGTTNFSLSVPDLILEAFERIQIRANAITLEHLISARRSLGLVFSSKWSNRGVNLWAVELAALPLVQGVSTYTLPASTMMVLDAYLRQYGLAAATSYTPAFATTLGSTTVTATVASHGLSVGWYVNVVVPVALGGIIISGFYQVVSVPTTNTFTFTALAAATSSVSGGTVPSFATTSTSTTVTATLAAHGYLAGQAFVVQVSTTVGGITLSGSYTITATTTNTFTFTAPYAATSTTSASENTGRTQIALQTSSSVLTDIVMTPISRTDYSSMPDKASQGVPTVFWLDRLATPTLTVWQTADANGPYEFRYYRMRQINDVTLVGAQTLDMPVRFYEAACAELALHLAMKYPPNPASGITFQGLEMVAKNAWVEAAGEDRERVTLYLTPDLSEYFS